MSGGTALELITRRGCGLCEAFDDALTAALAGRAGVAVRRTDVDGDPELVRRFGWHVPVLRLDGAVVCAHHLDAERLATALAGGPWEPLELR